MEIVFPILFDTDLTSFAVTAVVSLPLCHATIIIFKDGDSDIHKKSYICMCKLICSEKMFFYTDMKKCLFENICIKLFKNKIIKRKEFVIKKQFFFLKTHTHTYVYIHQNIFLRFL